MPEVINGCGTWYYGKNRIHVISGKCQACGQLTEQRSYDTTKYFVLFFVPLLPLSKWRVLKECRHCSKHGAIKLHDWEEAKRRDSADVTRKLRENPQDPETIIEVLGVATGYQDEGLFLQVAEHLAGPMRDHARVQAALGDAYAYFSRGDQAVLAYEASLAAKDDPDVHEALAVQLLRQGKPEQAELNLSHILQRPVPDKAGLLLLLAEGYQGQAQHDRAIELMDQAAAVSSSIQDDKAFQRDRKKAEKYRQSGKAVKPVTLATPRQAGYREGGRGPNLVRFIAPALVFAGLCAYFFAAWRQGQHREVFLVNGLGVPYHVRVGDQSVELPAGGHRKVEVIEGTLHVTADAQGTSVDEHDIEIHTPLWKRPFLSRTFVINPDRTALVTHETVYYSVDPDSAPDAEYDLQFGEPFYTFTGVDYPFQVFPAQIDLPSKDDVVARTRVATESFADVNDSELLFLLQSSAPPDEPDLARRFVTTHLKFTPQREVLLLLLKSLMSPEEYIAYLADRLDDRPVLVHWHRVYQEMMESQHPEHDLAAEYRAYYDAAPNDAGMAYLLGRVLPTPEEAQQLFRQAIEAEHPSAFGYNALAYQYLSEGRFDEALPLAEKAVELQPDSPSFTTVLRELRLATGQWDQLLEEARQNKSEGMFGVSGLLSEVRLLAMQGDQAAARQVIDNFTQELAQESGEGFATSLTRHFNAMAAYFAGDAQEYLQLTQNTDEPAADYMTAFVAGDFELAARLAAENEDVSSAATQHLAQFLKAGADGKQDIAAEQLQLGIEKLRQGDREDRIYAGALAADGVSEPKRLLQLAIWPTRKRVILAALGTKYPGDQEAYFTLARRLNFEREVPWLFLRDYLGGD